MGQEQGERQDGLFVVDAQVHAWRPDSPERPWPEGAQRYLRSTSVLSSAARPAPTGHEVLAEMDRAGVRSAILVPPVFAGDDNGAALEQARSMGRRRVEPSGSGWVDVNVHYGPDVVDRSQTAREAVAQAIEIGCAAICLRSHAGSSVDLANALDAEAGDALRVFGGITLNRPVGGLNLDAVDVALTDVLARVAEADACVDLGPVAPDELLRLVTAARSAGVRRVVVSHPFYPAQDYPDELVVAAAGAGAMVEHCAMQFRPGYPDGPPLHRLVDQIERSGPRPSSRRATAARRASPPSPNACSGSASNSRPVSTTTSSRSCSPTIRPGS